MPDSHVELTCPGLLSGDHDRFHFLLAGCPDCVAYALAGMTLEQVENHYHQGLISQDAWEGYCWVWATSAARFGSYDSWKTPPAVASARQAGERIRLAHVLRRGREAGS
jgi:hypothetical protein